MKTWADVQKFIDRHSLPYRVQRFNMTRKGCLISLEYNGTEIPVANTVKAAANHLPR